MFFIVDLLDLFMIVCLWRIERCSIYEGEGRSPSLVTDLNVVPSQSSSVFPDADERSVSKSALHNKEDERFRTVTRGPALSFIDEHRSMRQIQTVIMDRSSTRQYYTSFSTGNTVSHFGRLSHFDNLYSTSTLPLSFTTFLIFSFTSSCY